MSDKRSTGPVAASVFDTLRVVRSVLAPTIAKGVIKRRPLMEATAEHGDLDAKAVQLMQRLRTKYGDGPLKLSIPFRPQVLLLDAAHVAQVLEGAPSPFSPATKEKRSALAHFEPGNVLISGPERREELRPVHENALATETRRHPFFERFQMIIDEEFDDLLSNFTADKQVKWKDFAEPWFRIVRRVVLGDRARDDAALTGLLDELRRRANWAFAIPTNRKKLRSFQMRIAAYLQNPEPVSLIARLPDDRQLQLESQIAQWLFAFDAAGIATFRALALVGSHHETQEALRQESKLVAADRRFARAIFLDTIRLWPTTPAILRELTEDAHIGETMIRKGTGVIIFAPFFHRDDEHLAFAHRLNPAPWVDQEAAAPKGLVPFSAGPAMCPAHNLVPMLGSLTIGMFLQETEISLLQPAMRPDHLPASFNHFGIALQLSHRSRTAA
ncbi:cytochrome P450 [Neorhizobium sp. 2083]|uniref:cytochrome P450 n=1 Tax=Neorhizobium sp. 2083 TaxID=2817762 RepID=UPI0028582D56|nr:cytochrome P450 [Neorhizobium sp. 2083]MDR6821045.1 cytochrome P450 [Neorhizobium sp. 2083]